MANKKKFDQQVVLQAAMQLFWQNGYHATSTRDLQEATALKPGSLYACFTNKETLYAQALDCYVQSLKHDFDSCLEQEGTPLTALKAFTIQSLIEQPSPCKLCFLHKSCIELKGTELEQLPRRLLAQVEHWFLQVFIDAHERKQLRTTETPEQLVKRFQVQLLGWRAYLAVSEDAGFVQAQVEEFFQNLL